MKRLLWFSVLVALMVCCSQTVKAQPPPANIVINQSNVTGGTVGNCLDITTAHKVGSTPCGSGGGAPTGPAGGSLSGTYPNPGIATSVSLPGSPTTTTQSAADNSTKVATTAYADRAATIACPAGSSGTVQKTNGTNCAASSITDNGSTVVTTEPLSAPSFTGTGSNPFINFPSNLTHTGAAGDLWNNAGILNFGATPLQVVTGPASATSGHLAKFNGASGASIQDGGVAPSGGQIWVDGVTYATISAAVAAVPSAGGSVHLPDHYRETIVNATKVTLGTTTKPVTLIGGADDIITCNVTDGTYCFGEPSGSGIVGTPGTFIFTPVSGGLSIIEAATANVASVVKNTTTTGQTFVINQGYVLYGDGCSGATTSVAALNLDGVFGPMVLRDVQVYNFCNTTEVRVASNASATAGPYTLDNLWLSCNGNTGCIPLQAVAVTSNFVGLRILGGGYGQPGSGQTVINIDGSGGSNGISGVLIEGPDVENNANGSSKIIALKNVNNAVVTGATTIFQNTDTFLDISESSGGLTQAVSLDGLSASCPSTGGTLINNHITGYTQGTNGGSCLGFVNSYLYPGSDSSGLYVDGSAATLNGITPGTAAGDKTFGQVIAHGSKALDFASTATGACATVITDTATGAASTDVIIFNANASIKAVTGYVPASTGGFSIAAYPTTNTVNFEACNWTAGTVDPGSITVNWKVIR